MKKEKSKYTNDEEETEEDVYSEEGRDSLVDSDGIEPWEEGFMEGAEDYGQGAKCRRCGNILINQENIVEREIKGEIYRFCSAYCANKFEEKKK